MSEPPIYKQHRIHTTRLFSGAWVSMIVNVGRNTVLTKDALTDTVTRVPGEYAVEDEAIQGGESVHRLRSDGRPGVDYPQTRIAPASAATDRGHGSQPRSTDEGGRAASSRPTLPTP